MNSLGTSEGSFHKDNVGVDDLLRRVISLVILDSPSQEQSELALAMSEEIIARARETQEWFRTEMFGRANAATALLDLGLPVEAKTELMLALQKASAFSISAEDRIKALALLGACEKALNNVEAAKAAYNEAIRFADRVLAGKRMPPAQKLLRVQVQAIKLGQGPAYVEVISSVRRHRQAVEETLKELTAGIVSRPSDVQQAFDPCSPEGESEPDGSPTAGQSLSSTRPDLVRLIEWPTDTPCAATGSHEELTQIIANNRRALEIMQDLNESDSTLTIQAHHNIGAASMRMGQLEQAKAELLEAERLSSTRALDLRVRYSNWNVLCRVLILMREDDRAGHILNTGLGVARGLLRKKLVKPRGAGVDITQHQWDILHGRPSDESRELGRFLKQQQKELRRLRERIRKNTFQIVPTACAMGLCAASKMVTEVKRRLPQGVLQEWPQSEDGEILAEWLHEHGYDSLDPTLISQYYPKIASLNDFLADVVLGAVLPTVREEDRRTMASQFETGGRPYSVIGLIETTVENDQEAVLTNDDSRTIAELTSSVHAVPHAKLPGEIHTVLKGASPQPASP